MARLMMSSSGISYGLAVLMVICCTIPAALAAVYTVGDSSGWSMGGDYGSWTSDKSFAVGDTLVFNYFPGHTVDEVGENDYKSCTTGNAITSDSSGATSITLKTTGSHYFICGVPGHCSGGMKLAVTVAAGAPPVLSGGAGAAAAASPSTSPSTSPTSSPTPTDSSSSSSTTPETITSPSTSTTSPVTTAISPSPSTSTTSPVTTAISPVPPGTVATPASRTLNEPSSSGMLSPTAAMLVSLFCLVNLASLL